MKAKGKFITALMMLNAVFGGYALGFNSRHVDVIDPTLPPLEIEKKEPAIHHSKAASHEKHNEKNSKTKHAIGTNQDTLHEKKEHEGKEHKKKTHVSKDQKTKSKNAALVTAPEKK